MHGYYVNKILTPLPTLHHPLFRVACTAPSPTSSQNARPLQLQISYCPYSSVRLGPLLSQAHLLLKDLMSCPVSSRELFEPLLLL